MGNMKITDEISRHIDSIDSPEATDPYTPSKAKKVISENLFNQDGYSKNVESEVVNTEDWQSYTGIKFKFIILVIILIGVVLAWGAYKYIDIGVSKYNEIKGNARFDGVKNTVNISGLPIKGIISDSKIDTDGDGLLNSAELKIGSSTVSMDSDNDGIPDRKEYNSKGLNIIGNSIESRLADINNTSSNVNKVASIEKLDIDNIARALNTDRGIIDGAYKIYNAVGETEMASTTGVKTLVCYVPESNGFKVLKYKKSTDGIKVTLDGDCVVILFNISERNLFKQIGYKKVNNIQDAFESIRMSNGLVNYDSVYKKGDFKCKFNIEKNALQFLTVCGKNGITNGIGQAWFTGAIFNGATITNYAEIDKKYDKHKYVSKSKYDYNMKDYNNIILSQIQFKSDQLSAKNSSNIQTIELDKLPRPDKEIVGAIAQLNSIGLERSITDIALKDYSTDMNVIKEIKQELNEGRVVLAVVGNKDGVHALVIYGMYQSEIDNDVYNFAVYDSNINCASNTTLQILQARLGRYVQSKDEHIKFRYGFVNNYLFDTTKNDVFLFYKIKTNLDLDIIK